jgi:hypothetical protein
MLVYSLTMWNTFISTQLHKCEKKQRTCFDILMNLCCCAVLSCKSTFHHRWLSSEGVLGLFEATIKGQGICWCDSWTASHSVHGTQVSQKSDMFRLSVRMIWCDANEILNILGTSWVMILLFWKMGSFTQNTFFICFAVDGFLEHLATSTEVTPILSWNTIWKVHIFHSVSSVEASLNVLKVTVTYFPNLKQDLMQTFW